jgi:hypothetical protein
VLLGEYLEKELAATVYTEEPDAMAEVKKAVALAEEDE